MTNEAPLTEVVSTPATVDPVAELVGEGKKYKSVEELAKAKKFADEHIARIEQENAELREKQLTKVDEVLELVKKGTNAAPSNAPGTDLPNNGSSPSTVLNEEAIKSIVTSVLVTEKTQSVQKENKNKTLAQLSEHYGSEELAKRAINKVAAKSPLYKEALDKLAFNDPIAAKEFVTSFVAKDSMESPSLPATSSAQVLGDKGSTVIGGTLTWSSAQEIRRKNPSMYNSADFQKRLEAAASKAAAEGKNFYQT